ncbi:MAG: 50S ribosomal protein L18 [Candidatus Marinimicrobia bacterium]|nr:50S ribosomal protein L18 [Candidatus Neomarinimicrobiota bacterium]
MNREELKRVRIAKRKLAIKRKFRGTSEKPRLVVFRSNKHISVQIVDDTNGVTLMSYSSNSGAIPKGKNKTEISEIVGKQIAEKAIAVNIESVVFDRNGYLYHGRVKSLAESARKSGLKF